MVRLPSGPIGEAGGMFDLINGLPVHPLIVHAIVILLPIATSSGEALERRVGDPGRHAAMGDMLIWFAVPLAVLALALTFVARRAAAGRTLAGPRWLPTAVAVLAVVAAVATGVQVYRVGDSGAKAVWADQVHASHH